jgi:hypothetical protein
MHVTMPAGFSHNPDETATEAAKFK